MCGTESCDLPAVGGGEQPGRRLTGCRVNPQNRLPLTRRIRRAGRAALLIHLPTGPERWVSP